LAFILITLRESIRAISHRFVSFLGSVLTVFLATLIAGCFILVAKNIGASIDKLKAEASLEIYLESNTDSVTREKLQDLLAANEYILQIKFITKDIALYKLREIFGPEMVAGLKTNPLPESYAVTLDPSVYEKDNFEKLIESLYSLPGVEDIGYVPAIISRLKTIFRLVTILGLAIGTLVTIATGFIVGNTIGVTIAERRLTFYVMRLVGASYSFICSPYLFMGFLIALLGSCLSVGVLKIGAVCFSKQVASVSYLSTIEVVSFVVGCGIIGLVGSYITLKRYSERL
jgi:cell division transport system permease protein